MSTINFSESTIPQNYAVSAKGATDTIVSNEEAVWFSEAVIAGVSDFLCITKSQEKKVALAFNDLKGNLVVAAVVEYNKNENEDAQDNWNYYWTFDKADLEEATVYESTQAQVLTMFTKRALTMHRMTLNHDSLCATLVSLVASTISDYLDQNAKEGEKITVEHKGFFTASAEVKDGVVVKAFVPAGEMKVLVKGDSKTEK